MKDNVMRRITITPLSPVHIGCDEDYLPTNFVVREGLLHYLDMGVLADELDVAERNALGSRQTIGAIQQFFKSKSDRLAPLASHLVEMAPEIAKEYEEKAGRPAQQGDDGNNFYSQFFISRSAYRHLDGAVYLPGSSIKGSIRTAWLDHVNKGRPLDSSELETNGKPRRDANLKMQQRLLNYEMRRLEDDPFRHLKISDAHNEDGALIPPTRIVYSISKKKRPSERGTPELRVYLESVVPMISDLFSADIRMTGGPFSWESLCDACNAFYLPSLEDELGHPHLAGMLDTGWRRLMDGLLGDELGVLCKNRQGFLLRVGRHSGAESVTLSGVRHIEIRGKQGEPSTFRPETTERRFASMTRNAMAGLMPFGWVWVESSEDEFQHVAIALRQKLAPHGTPARELQRQRLDAIEAARTAREAAAIEARKREIERQAAEQAEADREAARQQALLSLSPNQRKIEELRAEIERRLVDGRRIGVSDQFWGGSIKKLASEALESADWTPEEKAALAEMLQVWAGKLMQLDPKDLRKQLKLAVLRGQA